VKQVQKRQEVVNWRAVMIKQATCGVKMIKKPSNELFLGTTGLNIVIDNPESVVEVVSSINSYNLTQLLTEESNLYHSHNAPTWKVLPKTLKWSNITHEEMIKFLSETCRFSCQNKFLKLVHLVGFIIKKFMVHGHMNVKLGHNYHIYQDNFYNRVRLAQTLLDRNVTVIATMRSKGHST
jgi:hypothetical protein